MIHKKEFTNRFNIHIHFFTYTQKGREKEVGWQCELVRPVLVCPSHFENVDSIV